MNDNNNKLFRREPLASRPIVLIATRPLFTKKSLSGYGIVQHIEPPGPVAFPRAKFFAADYAERYPNFSLKGTQWFEPDRNSPPRVGQLVQYSLHLSTSFLDFGRLDSFIGLRSKVQREQTQAINLAAEQNSSERLPQVVLETKCPLEQLHPSEGIVVRTFSSKEAPGVGASQAAYLNMFTVGPLYEAFNWPENYLPKRGELVAVEFEKGSSHFLNRMQIHSNAISRIRSEFAPDSIKELWMEPQVMSGIRSREQELECELDR